MYKIDVLNQIYINERLPSLYETEVEDMKIEIPEEMSKFTDVNDIHPKVNNIIEMFNSKIPQINMVSEDVGVLVLNKEQLEKIKENMHIWF